MKFRNKIFAVSAAVAAAAMAKKTAENIIELPEGFTLTAHTGCEGTKDNSLDAITVGYVSGADIVEFDLFFDINNNAVLSHDMPMGKAVTLDEAFCHIAKFPGLRVNVDVKVTNDLKQVKECAEKYGILDRIFYTGITAEYVDAVQQSTPDIPYYLNISVDKDKSKDEAYISSLIEEIRTAGAIGINMHYKGCTKLLTEKFREAGLLVSLWTVNNRFDMKKVLFMEPDNITTRKPAAYYEIICDVTNKEPEDRKPEYF